VTKRRAEALTGYEIRRLPDGENTFCYGAFSGEELMAEAQHRKGGIALTLLVERVYQIHSRRVLETYGWRCARCGRTYLLQVHHRQFRSHGGTHRPENLEPVCGFCHRLIHAHERSR
jgi:HNH endonuclease